MHVNTATEKLLASLEPVVGDGRRAFVAALQRWLRDHLKCFSPQVRQEWELEVIATMDISSFPVEDSDLPLTHPVQLLKTRSCKTMNVLAGFISGIWWEGVTVEADVICPRCTMEALRFLQDHTGALVLGCMMCPWAQTASGTERIRDGMLLPATTTQVKAAMEHEVRDAHS